MAIRLDYKSDLRERRAAARARDRERHRAISMSRAADKSGLLARMKSSAARRMAERGEPDARP